MRGITFRKGVSILAAVVVVMALAINAHAERKEYRIGAIFATSGGAAMLGEPEKLTVEMLVEELNAKGGIAGVPVKVFLYDTEGDPTKAHSNTKKLIDKDEVDVIIGPTTSGESLAIADLVEQEKVPLISCAASIKIVQPVRTFIFKTPQSDVMAVELIFERLKALGTKKIAILTVSNGFGDSGRVELMRLAPSYGLEIVGDERYGDKDTDMTVQLTKIKGSGAEAIVCWGTNPGPAQIAKNRKQLGITTPLYNSHGVASKTFIDLAEGSAEGTFLPGGKLLVVNQLPEKDPQKALLAKYKADYEGKYGKPVNTFGGHAYDSFNIAVMAIESLVKAGKEVTRAGIRDEVEKIKGFVGTGGIFNFSAEDHNGLTKEGFTMITIEGLDWKLAP